MINGFKAGKSEIVSDVELMGEPGSGQSRTEQGYGSSWNWPVVILKPSLETAFSKFMEALEEVL